VESAWCRIVCILILSSVVQCEVLVKGAANSADSHPLILHVGIYVYMYLYLYIYIYIYIYLYANSPAHTCRYVFVSLKRPWHLVQFGVSTCAF
jgi:hypothetical protein